MLAGIRELDEPLRKAYFVSSLGSEGQRTFFNLELRHDTFEAAMLAVQAHYRSEEHTSELQSPVPISYAVFCLKKKKTKKIKIDKKNHVTKMIS